ncbi:hypothetical protein [Nocardia sp. NPDC020380]|uniref:hypothetical protein n=1 Tax=unclassified Nocardia TaxID=2637762 RepID=UPI0037BC7925
MAIQGFVNILLDTVHPNRGWRYCGMCIGSGRCGPDFCSVCGGTGWLAETPPNSR